MTTKPNAGMILRPIIHARDIQASSIEGGGFTSGSFVTRVLNDAPVNTITGASLASNQITLPAGTYKVEGSAPGYSVGKHKARLRNITDGTTTIIGTSEVSATTTSVVSRSLLKGSFTITSSKVFEIQHQCQTTNATNGLGGATSIDTEVYAEIVIEKIG